MSKAGGVLAAIAESLTRQPANDAREHYPSLRARTKRLRRDFVSALDSTSELIADWRRALADDAAVVDAFRLRESDQEPFRRVAPIVAANFQRVARTLAKATEPAEPATDLDELDAIAAKFEDFIELGSAVRQFTDSLVETSYQLVALDAATFNYKFLESLASFAPVAPVSLRQTLYSESLQSVLTDFAAMTGRQRRNSTFSRNEHAQFGERVAWLKERLGATDRLEKSINKVFRFCSDFVHLGYASSVALGHTGEPQIVIGAGDYYTAPTVNFAELRMRLLGECVIYYAEVFASALTSAIEAMLVDSERLVQRAREIAHQLDTVRQYVSRSIAVEFMKDGLLESGLTISIECAFCQTVLEWKAPHSDWDCYCWGCGKTFQADVVPEAVDYIVSSEGVSKVNGSDAPEVAELPVHLRQKLDAIRQRHVPAREGEPLPYVKITDLERVDVETLVVPTIITSRPGPEYNHQFRLIAYVASKALERQAKVAIHCNCGAKANYETATASNMYRCPDCQTSIGIFGVSGDEGQISIMDVKGGPQRLVPIQEARPVILRNVRAMARFPAG